MTTPIQGRPRKGRWPRVTEKVEQTHIVSLLRSVGAVYVLGTRRPMGDFPGTRQTPGVPDVYAFVRLPDDTWRAVWVEVKAEGGRLSPDQETFRQRCQTAKVAHVVGGLDAVIAWLMSVGVLKQGQVPHYRLPARLPEVR